MTDRTDPGHRIFVDTIDAGIKDTLVKGLEHIQWDTLLNAKSRVFIKPNFTSPLPEKGVTTTPELIRVLLELLAGKAGSVIVGESDGGNHSFTADEAFEGHDMPRICAENGAELVNLSKMPSRKVEGTVLGKNVWVELPELLLDDIDFFISVPVLKVHVMTNISLSLKNSWGCYPDTMRGLHHQNLGHKLALIAENLKPKIVIVDGIYALDGHGPMYGEPVNTNLLMVADNTVAADAFGAALMGFQPRKVKHIRVAEQAGLGSTDIDKMTVSRDWKPFVKRFSTKKTFIDLISGIPFNSDFIARLILQSSLTPWIYKVIRLFRTPKEKEIAEQFSKKK